MKKGDKVRFLNEVGGGVVSGFRDKNTVLVEDSDGFEIPMSVTDVVVVADENYSTSNIFYLKNTTFYTEKYEQIKFKMPYFQSITKLCKIISI